MLVVLQASSQAYPEQGDGHKESWERQAMELHQRAIEAATSQEGCKPRGPVSGGLPVFYRYP